MLGCRACHRLDAEGGQLGPSLFGIGRRLTRQELHRTLMSQGPTDLDRHMPSYDYLFESERQLLLDVLEQQ